MATQEGDGEDLSDSENGIAHSDEHQDTGNLLIRWDDTCDSHVLLTEEECSTDIECPQIIAEYPYQPTLEEPTYFQLCVPSECSKYLISAAEKENLHTEEVILKAIRAYINIIEHQQRGGKVLFQSEDGRTGEYRLRNYDSFIIYVPEKLDSSTQKLFERLRTLCKQLAEEQHVPPYVISGDAKLRLIAQLKPQNIDDLSQILGVSRSKVDKFGTQFINEIRAFEISTTIEEFESKFTELNMAYQKIKATGLIPESTTSIVDVVLPVLGAVTSTAKDESEKVNPYSL